MPGFAQSLEGQDLGHLEMVADAWGIELRAKNTREAIQQLSAGILNAELVGEIVAALALEARQALGDLAANGGRLPWALFVQRYGGVRSLGPARRDKEQPQRNPASTSEALWYRGLVARAFFDTADGPKEFAYLPEDLAGLLPVGEAEAGHGYGRPARPAERAQVRLASDHILDEACSLLAGLRMGLEAAQLAEAEEWQASPTVLKALLEAAGLVDEEGQPRPETAREFLGAARGAALAVLTKAWLESENFNELRLLPGLQAEGNWRNEPKAARHKVLAFARSAPAGQWWSLAALVADVKAQQPDYQRPGGDYDSWYLRDEKGGDYLRGFAHWDAVDGALITFLLTGLMHWLGLVDLAGAAEDGPALAYRWSAWADALLAGQAPEGLVEEADKLSVDSQGQIQAGPGTSRVLRYQVARFCDWERPAKGSYRYRVRARSLEAAKQQGLEVRQLIGLLKAHSDSPLPPNLLKALQRWEQQGTEARLESVLVLRVSSAEALQALRASRVSRYLGDPLGPTAIEVHAGAAQHVLRALTEMGYLGEFQEDKDG